MSVKRVGRAGGGPERQRRKLLICLYGWRREAAAEAGGVIQITNALLTAKLMAPCAEEADRNPEDVPRVYRQGAWKRENFMMRLRRWAKAHCIATFSYSIAKMQPAVTIIYLMPLRSAFLARPKGWPSRLAVREPFSSALPAPLPCLVRVTRSRFIACTTSCAIPYPQFKSALLAGVRIRLVSQHARAGYLSSSIPNACLHAAAMWARCSRPLMSPVTPIALHAGSTNARLSRIQSSSTASPTHVVTEHVMHIAPLGIASQPCVLALAFALSDRKYATSLCAVCSVSCRLLAHFGTRLTKLAATNKSAASGAQAQWHIPHRIGVCLCSAHVNMPSRQSCTCLSASTYSGMTSRHSSVATDAPIGLPNVFLHSVDMKTCRDPSCLDVALCLHRLRASYPSKRSILAW